MTMSILAIVLGSLGLLCGVAALVYGIHVAVVYQRFNDGIKAWAEELDNSTALAIDRAARKLLADLDQRISESNAADEAEVVDEDVEPLNNEDYE